MNEVFIDTSGWASFFVRKDPNHEKALKLMTQWRHENRNATTTNYVLSELIALFIRFREKRSTVLSYIKTIRSAPWVEIVHIDEDLDEKAWQFLASRLDKQWSLVDAASFIVMQERNLTEALTEDHHFEQAGFVCLLK